MNSDINSILDRLSRSKFRSSFHLNKKMIDYVNDKGMDTIYIHAHQIIENRLKPSFIPNDGKQTPMKQVHPVFIAQHACACCCRGCLEKWYKISKTEELTDQQINYIVDVLIAWINRETRWGVDEQ